jgi:hypothetical protein
MMKFLLHKLSMLENIILTAGWLGGIAPRYEGEQENDVVVIEWFFST